jgi:beta-lactamase class A
VVYCFALAERLGVTAATSERETQAIQQGTMRLFAPFTIAISLLCCPQGRGGETSLAQRLTALAKAHNGKVAICVQHLDSGEHFVHNGDDVMPTASLIKFPVMIEVYQQVADGKIKLSDMVILRKEDMVQGAGILTYHFSDGTTFPLRDAVRLMIAYSDNTATNLVLDKIGIASTGKRMATWGAPNTKIYAKVFRASTTSIDPEGSKKYGLGSTTAKEMVGLFVKLHQGKLISPGASKEMLEHLKNCQDKDTFRRLLPEKTVVAHKTGRVSAVRTDAGIIYTPGGPVALCVLTADNADKSWGIDNAGYVLCARVAKEVYDHFTSKGRPK